MTIILSDTEHVARKTYDCNSRELWERSGYGKDDVTETDWALVEEAQAAGWKIMPGQRYRRVVYKDGDKLHTYRTLIGMDDLCERLELFDE